MNTPTVKAIDRRSVHQICSGQVVVTLSTALKELVENSLDGGATNIEIRLKNWGADSIEVVDNGSGVLPENFQALALKHHTSKLNVFADLVGVETFGFRGEALSSLCALSELSITTCHHSKSIGARIEYNHDGQITKQAAAARVPGTTVTLLNLFSTLPVRHKEFLRNLKREYAKLIQVLQSYCVISTGVRFSCHTQSEKGKRNMVVSTNGNVEMKENISNVFGPKQLQSLLMFQQITAMREDCEEQGLDSDVEIDESCTVFRLTGFVSRCDHGAGRSTSDRQYIFINRRPCDLPKVIRVVNEVYHLFNRNQYPFLTLNISLDKELVDVNVTPDKRQVFLQQEKLLLATIKSSLKTMFDPGTSSYELKPLSQIKLGSGMPKNKAGATEFSKSIKDRLLLANASNVGKEKRRASILDYTKKKLLDPHVELNTRASLTDCSNNDCNNRTNSSTNSNSDDIIIINSTNSHNNNSSDNNIKNNSTNCSGDSNSDDIIIINSTSSHNNNSSDNNSTNISSNNNNGNSSDNNVKNNSTNINSTNSSSDSNSNIIINNDDSTNNNTNDGVEQILLDSCVTKQNVENPESCCTEEKATQRMQSADAEENLCSVLECQDGVENGGNDISEEVVAGERHTDKLKRKLQDEIESVECSGESVRGESKRIKLDDKAVTKRKTVAVEFDWRKLRSKMSGNSRENCTEKRSNSARTFRAAINPESNQSAEEELRRHVTKEMFSKMEIIGQFNQGFVITKLKDDLFIIDQHASDEKYNFEEQQKNTVIKSQRLISPQALDLTAVNESILIEDIDIFKKNGFDFEIDEEAPVSQRVKLVSLPVSRNWSFGKSDIEELIFMLSDSPGVSYRPSNVRKMFASRACRMSIMVGTALNKAQMRRIVGHMGEMEHPWNCPHGRPTMRHMINLNMVRK